eukprot:403370559
MEKVNERDIQQHQLKSKSMADLQTAFGLINEIDKSVRKASQLTNKTFLANEIAHAKLLKLKQKRMLEEVDQQKHVIRYKNDWIFRDDVGFETGTYNQLELPPINLQPPVVYNTRKLYQPRHQCHSCDGHGCYQCKINHRYEQAQEEYQEVKNALPPIYHLNHHDLTSYRVNFR